MPRDMRVIPSNQVRGWRQVYNRPILADNELHQVDLPRGAALESAMVIIDGSINVTVAFATVRTLAPLHFLQRLVWKLNGNVSLDDVSGIGAHLSTSLTRRRQFVQVPPAAAGVGAKTIRGVVTLDRVLLDMVRPKDSVLKTDEGVNTNQLQVQLGTLASMFTGAGTVVPTALTISVYVQDYLEQPVNGKTPNPYWYVKRSEVQQNLAATGANQPFRINTGNRLGFLILRAENGGEPAANILTRVKVLKSSDVRMDLDEKAAAANLIWTQQQDPSTVVGTYVIDFRQGAGVISQGRYSEFWPLPSNADAQLNIDVGVAATTLRIVTVEGVDIRAGGNGNGG